MQQTSQQRPNKGCTLIFDFLFTVEGEGGGGTEFYFSYTEGSPHEDQEQK
jgi:hypothetical protein